LFRSAVPTTSSSSANLANLSSSHVDDIFGSSSGLQASTTTTSTSRPATATAPATTTTASKAPFDDLDDEFEGLEDAREGSADDDFATISRSGFDDFNPVFDSSPPPSQPKPVVEPASSATTVTTIGGGAPLFGAEANFDFGSTPGNNTGANEGTTTTSKPADSHDWDALFAGLDNAVTPTPSASAQTLATTAQGQDDSKEGAKLSGENKTEEATGGHSNTDDAVATLVKMGYSRLAAVTALEASGNNLERVIGS
jgi:epidermal growth factor receptor substrate 15